MCVIVLLVKCYLSSLHPTGMDWVVSNGQLPGVVSMSLGGGASSTTDNAVKRLYDAGFTVSVAAGNSDDNACGLLTC